MEKTLPTKGNGMIIVHHLGKSSQDSRNLSKCQIARGRSPSESLGALDMNSSNESCTIKQKYSGSVETLTTMDNDNSPYPVNMDIVRKDYA